MLELKAQTNNTNSRNKRPENSKDKSRRYKRLASMRKMSTTIINELYNPIDAVNRFINLALQSIEENSQSRQFLIESKQGIRRTSLLLKKLNNYVKKIEQEVCRIEEGNE